MLILGLETTCDETAAAIVEDGRIVHSSVVRTQIDLHQKFGGVVPEIASRAHLESLSAVVEEALNQAGVHGPELAAVAVANTPGLIGCLIVGVAAAKTFAFAWQKPLIAINHVQAHLYSVFLSEKIPGTPPAPQASSLKPQDSLPFPAIGLVISGGHTALYLVENFDSIQRIGSTQDDAVGEAFDKVAAILQLGYPGGPLIDRLSRAGNENAVRFPISLLEKDSLDFSFSGLKTAVLYHVNGKQGRERDASVLTEIQKAGIAASFQRTAAETLAEKCRRAIHRHAARALIVGGGVSANSAIRARLQILADALRIPLLIPQLQFCTDNAAMIAGLAFPKLISGQTAGLDLESIATS